MPPKFKFSREEILQAALELTRESGISAVTARALGARLGSSAKPIFGLFENMQEVQQEVLKAADRLYQSYLSADMGSGEFPPYKASGMAYIRFAKEEKELFRLLFMRDRTGETLQEDRNIDGIMELIRQNTGMDEEHARLFHIEMWIYVHGIATMCATSYLDWDKDMISRMLTDAYEGMRLRYELKGDTG